MKVLGDITGAVSVAEFKRAVHLVADDTADDLLIDGLLVAAQETVETGTNRPLTRRSVELSINAGLGLRWWFPCAPVVEVTAIEWQTSAGDWQSADLAGVVLQKAHDEPQLIFPASIWGDAPDGAPVRITANVGFDVVPRSLSQAIILLAKEWFEAGISLDDVASAPPRLSFGVRALMKQKRYRRPCEFKR